MRLTETAADVLVEVAKLDERARQRDEELVREQRKREKHQAIRAAGLQEVSARLSMMKKRWENGEQVRDITRGHYGEENYSEFADTLATLEGRRGGLRGFEDYQ